MTHNKKLPVYIILLCAGLSGSSCKKNFETINSPWNQPTTASIPELFNGVVSSLPLTAGEQSVFNAWIYPITQQGMIVSGSYAFVNARDAAWNNYYTTLGNYRLLQSRIAESSNPSGMNNVTAMLKTLMAYKTIKTTNYFGNMPYSSAGKVAVEGSAAFKAAYDNQSDIYASVLTDLKWAVDNLSTSPSQYSVGAYDTFLGGDIAMWSKFANSLRLRVAVTMYSKNSAVAGPQIAEALAKPLLADGDNIGLWPSKIPGLKFEWREWSFTANCYLRMGSAMWSQMSSTNATDGSGIFDPRAKIFFETNNAGQWAAYPQNPTSSTPTEGGAPYDKAVRYTNWPNKGAANIYSPFNLYFEQDMTYIPELMLTAAEVHFLKAEVYNRGLGVTANAATAKTEYESGVTASLNFWTSIAFNSPVWTVNKPAAATATTAQINTLLANVAYNTVSPATALKQIYAQEWIDMYRQPWDAWTLLRRTGGATPMDPNNTSYYTANFGVYNRFPYPDNEVSYNHDNWTTATGGNDVASTKIWIMP
ncbi:MAG: SusD/RagB family nutrient-binding outer membrane lipoprotein [Bacteroidetes bacterium]|nr:SusD/RagB family nutrient-binding outer membrane lipoprotein [Bacteroidota bacterium]